DAQGDKRLIAYVVTVKPVDAMELKNFLSGFLPDYMIPSYFMPIEAIPLTGNGKVDKKALPEPVDEWRERYTAPGNEMERKLAAVWEKVLLRDKIGRDENFFMTGGDSIKAIQIVSRMRRDGYQLEIKDIFKNPTIAQLAPRITKVKKGASEIMQGPITGRIPLTPVQKEFFQARQPAPHHFNQAVILKPAERISKETLAIIFKKIQEHHDALRITFDIGERGIVQTVQGPDHPVDIKEYDYKGTANAKESMALAVNAIQAGINLTGGPLMKIGLFHLDDGDRVLIVIHHLVVDGVSWRILLEDIDTLYYQYKKEEKLTLPLKTGSFKQWSEKLQEYANSSAFLQEKKYWRGLESLDIEAIPRDYRDGEDGEGNYVKDTENVSFKLDEVETGRLLTQVNRAFGTEINDILLTALGLALQKTFGKEKYAVALEGHGREELLANVNISRTVGWFTAVYPVVLDISYPDDPGYQVKVIKENLRNIPHKGTGYGILKYLTAEAHKEDITFTLKPSVSFNYLGQFGSDVRDLSFAVTNEPVGHIQDLHAQRDFDFDINGMTAEKQLQIVITYNRTHYKKETAGKLNENLKKELLRLIDYCSSRERREFTPSDFTYKGLSVEFLGKLCKQFDIEDIYTLSPMQEGMLFHALIDGQSASYFEQTAYRLQVEIDIATFKSSFNHLLRRHDILRTVFLYQEIERPVQVVLTRAEVDFYYEDISGIKGEDAKAGFIKNFKIKDRSKTFDLSRDALMRISLFKLGYREYEVIWSLHHILMDGWCIGILNKEFFEIYHRLKEGRKIELPALRPYRDYICWLEQKERETARKYWREYLADYDEVSLVPRLGKFANTGNSYRNENVESILELGETESLKKIAQKRGVTLNLIMQGIWGILLGRYNNHEDVVFGSVVSGRPPEIDGIESMVGLFINTVPVRVQFSGGMLFGDLLMKLQESALVSEAHHYYPLVDIQAESPLKQNLIDHIYVFENYPIAAQLQGCEINDPAQFKVSNVEVFEQTNYDFNVTLWGSGQLAIKLEYNGNIFEKYFIKRIAGHIRQIIRQVTAYDHKKINEIEIITADEKEQILHLFNDTNKEYSLDKTIIDLFVEQVQKTPDHIALHGCMIAWMDDCMDAWMDGCMIAWMHGEVARNVSLIYHELNEQSDRLAWLLIEKGVRPDHIVGIMIPRSIEMVIGIFGILKAGGAYLPIDPEYPQERVNYMLKDSNAKILLTDDEKKKDNCQCSIVNCQLSMSGCPRRGLQHSAFITQHSNHLAYVIYTSGSTGKPKGVMVQHKNLVNASLGWRDEYRLDKMEVNVLQMASYAFDVSCGDLCRALLNGGTLLICPGDIKLNFSSLYHYICIHRVTLFESTPSLVVPFMDYIYEKRLKLSYLQLLIIGLGVGRDAAI
ncbi:MAG: condensation domain-containing protein, partial [Acidobacteria bacterium]|nr:condensation domain-containing protein [Acidobacteriota bacterium]